MTLLGPDIAPLRFHPARDRLNAQARGFTLVELMIVLVLLAVLAGIGVPSFRTYIVEQRARSTVADLRIALMTARSEAVKRNRNVELVAATGGWSKGWRIANPDSSLPDILNHVQTGTSDVSISLAPPVTVGFKASGRTAASADAKFQVVVGSGSAIKKRCVILKSDGRSESTDGDCPS